MKLGLPIWYGNKPLEKAFKRVKKLGCEFVEISLDYPWHPNPRLNQSLLKLSKKYELGLAFHLPILELNLVHPSDEISKPAFSTCTKFLSSLQHLNPIYVNLHLHPLLVTIKFKEVWNEVIKKAEIVATELQKFSKSNGLTLTFENGLEKRTEDLDFLLRNNLLMCLDLGHVIATNYQYRQKKFKPINLLERWIKKFRKVVYVIHLHDFIRKEDKIEDHLALGLGEINLRKVSKLVKTTNSKYILLECFHSLKNKKTIPIKFRDLKNSLKICRELFD
jgi:sugar phosphate isomerase/epimerase